MVILQPVRRFAEEPWPCRRRRSTVRAGGKRMVIARSLLITVAGLAVSASPASAQTPVAGEGATTSDTPGARSTSYDAKFFEQFAPRTALDIVRRIPGFTLDLGNTELRGFSGAGRRSPRCRPRR